jgi:ATP synthase protein I
VYVALKLGLTRLTCVYNVHLVKKNKEKFIMKESSKKDNLDQLDKKIEEFKSKKEENRPKRLKVQNDGWRMVIELVTGMVLGVSLGMALDYIVGSEPIFLIVFSLLGFMAGVKTMIATAKKMNETNN